MQRAYSLLTLKAVDEEKRTLTGIASTPSPDRMGDIVEPKGAEYTLPIPFLWQHDATQPVGHVTKARITASGIEVEVKLVKVDEPGKLKDRLDEAWQSIKAGLVRGMSIGFAPTEYTRIETGLRFVKWAWLELSAVTIPANAEASILSVKQFDHVHARAALGHTRKGVVLLTTPPGVSGKPIAGHPGAVLLTPRK